MRLQCGCPGTGYVSCMHNARGPKLETFEEEEEDGSDERDESGRSGRPTRDRSTKSLTAL